MTREPTLRAGRGLVTAVLGGAAVLSWSAQSDHAVAALGWTVVSSVVALLVLALLPAESGLRVGPRHGVGDAMVPRALLVIVGAGVALVAGASEVATLVALAAGVLAIAVEPIVVRLSRARLPWARHLPGVPDTQHRSWALWMLLPASLVGPFAAALVAADVLAPLAWAGLTLLGVAPVAALLLRGVLGQARAPRQRSVVARALRSYDAEFLIYTARPDDASYQVKMWLPYLERTGRRYAVVARTVEAAAPLAALTDAPVVLRATNRDLDELLTPSLGAVFYVNASSGNNSMVRYSQLTHVYLGHGDSDKPPSYNPTHAMYDRIFAAGQGAVDRYPAHGVTISPERFDIVGRPQAEAIDVVDPAGGVQAATPTVVYAPTWRGHVAETMLQSLPVGESIVRALLDRGARVIFRPHPFSYHFEDDAVTIGRIHAMLQADAQETGRVHLWGPAAESERSIVDCINESDAMVSDVSSVVSDYLFSRKPFVMMAISTPVEDFASAYPVARGAYVVGGDLAGLPAALDALLGDDPLAPERAAVRAYYLGDFGPDGYAEHFVEAARRAIDATDPVARLSGQARVLDDETSADLDVVGASAEPGDGADEPGRGSAESVERPIGGFPAQERKAGGSAAAQLMARARTVLGRPEGQRVFRPLRNLVPALVTAGVAALGAPRAVVGVLAAVSAVLLGSWLRETVGARRDPRALRAGVERDAEAWLLLLVALAWTGGDPWALAALGAAVAVGAETGGLQRWRGVVATHLPGLRVAQADAPRAAGAAVLVRLVAFVAVLLEILVPLPSVVVLAMTAAALVVSVLAFVAAWAQARRSARDEDELASLVEGYGPQFAVYFASNGGARYQYGMWEQYFQRIGRPFIVITRTPAMARAIAELTSAPVIHRPTLRSLDEVDPAGMSTVFYVNNATRNTHMVERPGLTHVWLNHGDSEKPACYNPVHGIYHVIFAAGQAAIDRYSRHGVTIPAEKFRIVGRPQVEHIAPARGPVEDLEVKTVLYAPTWVGPYKDTEVYSLPVADELLRTLLRRDDVRVLFRAHPLNYGQDAGRELVSRAQEILARDARETGRQHLWGPAAEEDLTIEECFNLSDAMISDVSAVVSDYLKSRKPMAIMAMERSVDTIHAEVPAARAAYVVPGDLAGLEDRLTELLVTDPLQAEREAMLRYYLGDFSEGDYAAGFLDAAREIIDAGRRRP